MFAISVWSVPGNLTFGQLPPSVVQDFLQTNCTSCHDELNKEGGLDLSALEWQANELATIDRWTRIYQRVHDGEMPPGSEPRPAAESLKSFLLAMPTELSKLDQKRIAQNGRATKRRLNRYEYENSLRDILNLPWIQVRDMLPEDGELYRFNKVGEALDVSHIQLARYMSAADLALRQAILVKFQRPEKSIKRYYSRDEFSLTFNFLPRENGTLPDRLSFPVLDSRAQPDVRRGAALITSPETREREAVGRVSSIFSDAGGYSWNQFRVPASGHYKLRFKGYSIWVSGGGIGRWFYEGFGDQKAAVYHLPLWHRPNADEVWPGRRAEPIGVYAQSAGNSRPLGAFDFGIEPTQTEVDVILAANEVVQTDGQRLFRTRVNGTDEQYVNPLATESGMPGYAIQWMEVEGPLDDSRTTMGYELMFGDMPLVRVMDVNAPGVSVQVPAQLLSNGSEPEVPPARGTPEPGRGRPGGFRRPGPRTVDVKLDVHSDNPSNEARRLLARFMQHCYRGDVPAQHLDRLLALFDQQYSLGLGFANSMIAVYTAVLASPSFIFIDELPGDLDQNAIATRLALLLWNSQPDQLLRQLAQEGKLRDTSILQAQVDRMLADERSSRFVEAFTDYWLDLRKVDDTSPSTTLYNDYELDDPLKLAAIDETRMFVAKLISDDLPARNVVDSDFTFLNERLAEHYGIPNVQGAQMRLVRLPPDSVRGGLLTQASVLKVTANGTTTSPVLRGNWVTERILGTQIPPPPPVPAVEPDIRGAVTIRQQLEKHRADVSCASCHAKMDPPGLALESFDVMGGFRDRYRAVSENATATRGVGKNGQAFQFHYALPVDSSGELQDGRPFNNIKDLKRYLIEDERQVASNLARQLTIYATGAPITFSDRAKIDSILDQTASNEYGIRSIIHAVIQSDLFLQK